jgi:hypothetical protein
MTRILNGVEGGNTSTLLRSIVTTEVGEKVLVSTVHLSINHGDAVNPLWYETMVFLMDAEGDMVVEWIELDSNRYETVDEALEGHANMVMKWFNDSYIHTEQLMLTSTEQLMLLRPPLMLTSGEEN